MHIFPRTIISFSKGCAVLPKTVQVRSSSERLCKNISTSMATLSEI